MKHARRSLLATLLVFVGAPVLAQEGLQAPPSASPVQVLGTQAGFGTTIVAGPGARLQLAPGVPLDAVRLLDGQPVPEPAWTTGWPPGAHLASVQLTGPAGEATPAPPLSFIYDPAAPNLQYVVGTPDLLHDHGLDQNVDRDHPPRHTDPERDRRVPLLWSPDGRRWLPALPRRAKPDASGVLADWVIAADRPQVFLWALAPRVFASGAPVAPDKLEMVRVWAEDQLSAVREMRLRVLLEPDGGHRLELVVSDLVGNTTLASWPLAR
jgi:hypothetical protein